MDIADRVKEVLDAHAKPSTVCDAWMEALANAVELGLLTQETSMHIGASAVVLIRAMANRDGIGQSGALGNALDGIRDVCQKEYSQGELEAIDASLADAEDGLLETGVLAIKRRGS